jgi:hypothetical protein
MTLLNHLPLLIAQTEPVKAGETIPGQERILLISDNFSGEGLIAPHWLIIAAGLVMLILSTVSIAQWWKHRHENSHPWLVFMVTARLAGLGYALQWTLFRVAQQQRLASPLTLMLSPGTFDHHVKAYLDTRSGWRREGLRRKTQAVRDGLFSDMALQSIEPDAAPRAA